MFSHSDKTPKYQKKSISLGLSKKSNNRPHALHLLDNRPKTVAQLKQQAVQSAKQIGQVSPKNNSQRQGPMTSQQPLQLLGWESLGRLNPRRYLPEILGGYTQEQMEENGLVPPSGTTRTQVNWSSSSRSRHARKQRRLKPSMTDGANVATVKLLNKSTGQIVYLTRKNQGYIKGGHNYHSERMLLESIQAEFPPEQFQVLSMYSERSPCDRSGHDCEHTSVPAIMGGSGDVAYSFDYHRDAVDFSRRDSDQSEAESEADYDAYYESDFDPLSGNRKGAGSSSRAQSPRRRRY